MVPAIAMPGVLTPASVLRPAGGWAFIHHERRARCLHAGANSKFRGPKQLTTHDAGGSHDHQLLDELGLRLATERVVSG